VTGEQRPISVSEADFGSALVAELPRLRAFARSLSGDRGLGDDLVQETIVKALANREKFTPGTNLTAWLITILRNHFYSMSRSRRREVEDVDGQHALGMAAPASQQSHIELLQFSEALAALPVAQREALVLVGASGFTYEEAAEICGVRAGTIKSRVSRAREQLQGWIDSPSRTAKDDAMAGQAP